MSVCRYKLHWITIAGFFHYFTITFYKIIGTPNMSWSETSKFLLLVIMTWGPILGLELGKARIRQQK